MVCFSVFCFWLYVFCFIPLVCPGLQFASLGVCVATLCFVYSLLLVLRVFMIFGFQLLSNNVRLFFQKYKIAILLLVVGQSKTS